MFRLVRCVVCVNKKAVTALGNGGNYSTGSIVPISTGKYTKVEDYYAGKSVFITGATGFLGKMFVERLLYNCKDIDKIYVLIRPKKGQDTDKRLKKIFDVPIFEKLKETRPEDLRKVTAIEGDITAPELGIKVADKQKLADQVSVVFHSAATVRFADTFDMIMNVNLEGTRKMIEFSKNMKKLDSFVYISTAYSNSNNLVIDEKLYPPIKDVEEVRRFVKEHGTNEKKVKEFLEKFPNPYALSKALCEVLLDQDRGHMPAIIVRPSIVSPILNEPVKGWTDSWVAATALFSNIARGLTNAAYGRQDVVCDLIPVDYVTNLTILAAAKGNKTKDVMVYNICSSAVNPITWKHASDLFLEESRKLGFSKRKQREVLLSMSPAVVKSMTFVLKTIPLFFADAGLVMRGKKPWHLKEHHRANHLRDLLHPFLTTSWLIKCNRTLSLIESLDEHDKRKFQCDPSLICWNEYMKIFCYGVKKYLLNGK
ncbi:putative fatty acyl-CoA reductase CG5065 [Zerene cesonia]|uniref:putative fatty acyl-CoA reductase CG5065 n=1 Tax=Zerene cesonia TaxID=33412 RepID=UPI0018E5409F|nr:putative fatty acyl-CoA reductase CG5065 [Zerene cesonia]